MVDAAGNGTFIRYHVVPEKGVETLDEATVKAKGENYLQDELPERLQKGPIVFKIKAQVADEGDVTDDATVQWPETRKVVELGTVKIDSSVANSVNSAYMVENMPYGIILYKEYPYCMIPYYGIKYGHILLIWLTLPVLITCLICLVVYLT
jgi:catalase